VVKEYPYRRFQERPGDARSVLGGVTEVPDHLQPVCGVPGCVALSCRVVS
jgi:hypothetical protein